MGHPLELSYNWRVPAVVATVVLVGCVFWLARSAADGWLGVAVMLGLLWAAFLLVVWGRTRALIRADGADLTVRRYLHTHVLDGRRVASVREYLTTRGPSYKVKLERDDRTYFVPSAQLQKGHSTFFDWLLTYAPEAELDNGSRRTIDQLRTRGLIE